jgi:hypothetical protein
MFYQYFINESSNNCNDSINQDVTDDMEYDFSGRASLPRFKRPK